MKHKILCAALSALGTLAAGSAQAQLFDRGGGLIYDNVQNITWLADANYAKTSGFDGDGAMSWQDATAWAEGLVYQDTVRNVSYDNWRLPSIHDLGSPGCNFGSSGTDCGYNVATQSSEIAHLFYISLGNKAFVDSNGQAQADYGLIDDPNNPNDESLFANFQDSFYWLADSHANSTSDAWRFKLTNGLQDYGSKSFLLYSLAVRDGDVAAVPLPGAAWLFGASLLGWMVNRRHHSRPDQQAFLK